MGIEKDIERLFASVLEKYRGNKAAAAASLDTNAVTFWGWASGKRKPPAALCKAIDMAGGVLLIPGEPAPARQENEEEILRLREKIDSLTRENALLNKLVSKYEAEEHEKKEASENQDSYTNRPTQASDSGTGNPSGKHAG